MNDLSAGRSEASHGAPEAPINAFLEGPIEGIEGAGGGEDEEGARSLQGSHLAVCRNWRRFVGLNSPIENEDEQYRDVALGILAVDDPTVVPWASTDSNPTASGGDLEEEEYEREGNRVWLPAVAARARGLGWLWSSAASWRSLPLFPRLFGGKYKCPKDQPAEVTEKILKKCHDEGYYLTFEIEDEVDMIEDVDPPNGDDKDNKSREKEQDKGKDPKGDNYNSGNSSKEPQPKDVSPKPGGSGGSNVNKGAHTAALQTLFDLAPCSDVEAGLEKINGSTPTPLSSRRIYILLRWSIMGVFWLLMMEMGMDCPGC
ncbi:hypothetical protein ACQ4PT_064358 [Festuca glaucescens]